jgi:hypothetical protein
MAMSTIASACCTVCFARSIDSIKLTNIRLEVLGSVFHSSITERIRSIVSDAVNSGCDVDAGSGLGVVRSSRYTTPSSAKSRKTDRVASRSESGVEIRWYRYELKCPKNLLVSHPDHFLPILPALETHLEIS